MAERFYLSEIATEKLFKAFNVKSFEELREKLDSQNQTEKTCFFNWTDENNDATCPVMKRNPNLDDETIAKRFCKICPRYLQVAGSKRITVEKINTVVHSTPRGSTVNAGFDFTESEWDKVYSQLITSDFNLHNYICNSCRATFEILGDARKHVMTTHGNQYNSAINFVLQQRHRPQRNDLSGLDTGYGS